MTIIVIWNIFWLHIFLERIMGNPEVDRHGEFYDPFKIYYEQIGEIEFRISGLNWQEDNYEISAFDPLKEFYEKQISSSKAVVMEFPPAKSDYTPGFDLIKIENGVYEWGVNKGLRNLCEEHRKRVFVIDPICNGLWAVQTAMELGFSGAAGSLMIDPFIGIPQKKLSRRHFLELAGVVFLFAKLNTILGGVTGVSSHWGQEENRKGQFLRKSFYGPDDFRNIQIAIGLQLIPLLVAQEKGNHVLVIGGWTHSRAIDYYLNHEKVLITKADQYNSWLGQWFPGSVREYAFEGEEWRKICEQPLNH